MRQKVRSGILILLAAGLGLAGQFAKADAGVVSSTVLAEAHLSDTEFVLDVCNVLDTKFYDPKSLDYPKLFNASLKEISEALKKKGVVFAPREIKSGVSESQAQKQFLAEFLKAKKLAGKANLGRDDLAFLAVAALLAAVDDSHTHFLPPAVFNETLKEYQGKNDFAGIGLSIYRLASQTSTVFYVGDVFPDSPAEKAGLKNFDIFVQVNGRPAPKDNTQELVDRIRGPIGTEVRLLMKRQGKLIKFKLKRATILPPVLTVKRLPLGKHSVDYLKIYGFRGNFNDQLKNYLFNNVDQGFPDGLVIDLRGNPGGDLRLVDLLMNIVLPVLTPTYTLKNSIGVDNFKTLFDFKKSALNCPIVVLIDGHSASGSEIFSAALQENKRAVIVGEKSAGMVSVASLESLDRGAGMYVTVFAFFTAKGVKLEKVGVTPDVVVKFDQTAILKREDNQLDVAYEELSKLMK